MKVVVTGATGLVGNEIVKRCLADARITKVVILTRKAVSMDIECHPKSDVIMVQDFTRYSDEVLLRLEGSSACLWLISQNRAIGAHPDQHNHNKAYLHHVNVELPLAAAKALNERIAPKTPGGSKFSFVFCSNRTKSSSLLSLGDPRKPKSEAEKGLCEIADASPETFSAWILRPSAIVTPDTPKKRRLVGGRSSNGVDVAQMAKAFVTVACEGYKDRVIDNDALLKM
ncbi:nucleoside-diphosphate-sugar epimerase [Fusarium austroafricanum]|uniref:Nucleoside-diphosphate-sugar epimerase n=1 Tax=Fusarium austroafricanum TaxID=2364996 RepID=A0A8H4NQW2_9HYPO|nr:nucleoside-diphosphate-sugar epimerase [Fusarium austroafricanum]